MADMLWRFFLLALLFHYKPVPRFDNNTDYVSVSQGDADYIENSHLLSFDTILENGVNQFGHGLCDPKRPSGIYLEAFVEETSFVHDGQDPTPLPPDEELSEIDPVQESVRPGFTDHEPVFYQTQERLRTYLREILNILGIGLGAQDHTTPSGIDQAETVVEETSFVHDGQDPTPLPPDEELSEIDPVQESVRPSFTDREPVFYQTQERFRTYLREILNILGIGLGAQDHTTPGGIDQAETVVEETSFVHDGRDLTPLPSVEQLSEIDPVQESVRPSFMDRKPIFYQTQERFRTYLREETSFVHDGQDPTPLPPDEELSEIDPVQESVRPSFTDRKPIFYQTQERFRTYLREILNILGIGLGAQDHTTPGGIDQAETVVEETSFVHDGQDPTPLPPDEELSEIDPVQESVRPSFTDREPVFYQTQERFRTYLREILNILGIGLGAQDHTTPGGIDQAETVVEETSFVHDSQDPTPLPPDEELSEIDPVQESVRPSFTDRKPIFYQTQELFRTYLREILNILGIGLGAQDHTTPGGIDQAETVVEETSFVHDGRDLTPLPSVEQLSEIDPVQESVRPSFTDRKPIFYQTQERFRTYLREETSFVHDGQDPTPLPPDEELSEIDPVQESVRPSFTDRKPIFYQTQERFRTYLREILNILGIGLGAQDHTTPGGVDQAETVVEETFFVHDGQDPTPLPPDEELSEIDPVQESVRPSFTDREPVFYQTQERFRTYLREILNILGIGLGAQDHTTPGGIDQAETVVEETSFVHDGRDLTPLPSVEQLSEIDPVQESVRPSFTDRKPIFYQTQERFRTYLREETSFVHDGRDPTPLPSAEELSEIDPVQESVRPSFTDRKPIFYQTQERFRTYLREILNILGIGLGAQDHTTPGGVDQAETVVEETFFVHDGQDPTPLPPDEELSEIDPVQESVRPSFTDREPVFYQTQERFRTYLREILNILGIGLGAQDHTTPGGIDQAETVVEETSFVHDGRDLAPLPSVEQLSEIDPVQESVRPSFTDRKPIFYQTQERFRTYLREETSFVHDGRDPTPLPSAEELSEIDPVQESVRPSFTDRKPVFHLTLLIGCLWEVWQPVSALLQWSSQMLSIMASVEAVLIIGSIFINYSLLRAVEKDMDDTIKMIAEWDADLSRFRSLISSNQTRITELITNQTRITELITDQTSPNGDSSHSKSETEKNSADMGDIV